MAKWSVGDWVFAYYSEDNYWYPAEIVHIRGDEFTVRYDYDDSEEIVGIDDLDAYSTYVGERGAECYWDEDEEYYAVTIRQVNGESVFIEYEDGTQEWTDLANLRFEQQP